MSRLGGLLGVAAAAAVAAMALRILVFSPAPLQALDIEVPPEKADAILVPGGDPYFERTTTAVRLWKAGFAPVVLFSGAGGPGDSCSSMADYARGRGLLPAAIRVEGAARSTHENMHFSAPLLRALGARRLLLVTSREHLLRATLTARREMPEVTVIPVAASGRSPATSRRARQVIFREYVKLLYYVLRRYA
jgi:uncharacterized SAM-binding protein YcdF (DUF218 family)